MLKKVTVSIKAGLILSVLWLVSGCATWQAYPKEIEYKTTFDVTDSNYNNAILKGREYLNKIKQTKNLPSISISIGHKNKIIWSEAIGYEDIENNKRATINTKYRIGSTSKTLTATAAAILVDREMLKLDDSIAHIIPNFPKKKWNFTSRQLLSHTAGIVDYKDLGLSGLYYTLCNCKQFNSVSESLKVFRKRKLQYQPTHEYYYNSFDYVLMSSIIELKSNSSFLEFMKSKIFVPLEMNSTIADHSESQIDNIAKFYKTKANKYKKYKTFGLIKDVNLSYKWAGGGFLSTPQDLVKLGNAYLAKQFISNKVKYEFFKPQALVNGKVNDQKYALGWRVYNDFIAKEIFQGKKSIMMIHHGGISKGAMTFLILFPEYDMVLAASTNTVVENFWNDFASELFIIANYFLVDIKNVTDN